MLHQLSLVVATKDRPRDLRNLLVSLNSQSAPPSEIIIVDASSETVEPLLSEFTQLPLRYIRHLIPSAAAQRNAGIFACKSSSTLIGFSDDDTVFEPESFERMMDFWNAARLEVVGAAFNIRNLPMRGPSFLKHSALSRQLGLYSPLPGTVSQSGWQTVVAEVSVNQPADWLPSTAVTFRRDALTQHRMDEFFDTYSYLEDLDFSYSLRHCGTLIVVADAGYSHHPSSEGRISSRLFGRNEVRNRLYFVRKHRLSLVRCYAGLLIRMGMTLSTAARHLSPGPFARFRGNLSGLTAEASRRLRRKSTEVSEK